MLFIAHIYLPFSSTHLLLLFSDGCGGKGNWGKLIDIDADYHIDRNDPNYDSGEVVSIPSLSLQDRNFIIFVLCVCVNKISSHCVCFIVIYVRNRSSLLVRLFQIR